MTKEKVIDHLFRHQYGKMVSIFTRIFGLSNLETIEDAVQDTFIQAVHTWQDKFPENPEAWLTKAAKNRIIDLFRKVKADTTRLNHLESGPSAISLNDLFLEHEIEDSELRMIFIACHPELNPKDQIAFSLKTISGFSGKEIAAALLIKEETVKKRLARARKSIQENNIQFDFPSGKDVSKRLDNVLQVIYLIFNEGFHSNRKDILIRKDLCGEAIRLCKIVMKKVELRKDDVYALFALMCFHSARLESKINEKNEIVDLKNQNRNDWYKPLIVLGNDAMNRAVANGNYSTYHYEAAIAWEHLNSPTFEKTNWDKILMWYSKLDAIQPSDFTKLNKAIVLMQQHELNKAFFILNAINPNDLEQKVYLYYGAMTEYYVKKNNMQKVKEFTERTLDSVTNELEKEYFLKKLERIL